MNFALSVQCSLPIVSRDGEAELEVLALLPKTPLGAAEQDSAAVVNVEVSDDDQAEESAVDADESDDDVAEGKVILDAHNVEHDEEVGDEEDGELAEEIQAAVFGVATRLNHVRDDNLEDGHGPDERDLPDEGIFAAIEYDPGQEHAAEEEKDWVQEYLPPFFDVESIVERAVGRIDLSLNPLPLFHGKEV